MSVIIFIPACVVSILAMRATTSFQLAVASLVVLSAAFGVAAAPVADVTPAESVEFESGSSGPVDPLDHVREKEEGENRTNVTVSPPFPLK